MTRCDKKNSFLGLLAGSFLSLFGRSQQKTTVKDLKYVDFKTSTQQMGVRFTEKVRDVFRFKWLVRKRKS
jgi:hypothetical protein